MSLIVLGDVLELEKGISFEITEGFVLRRATDNENELIAQRLKKLGGNYAEHFAWRFEIKREEDGSLTRLPVSDWKYSVIEHSKPTPIPNLELSTTLASCDLHWLFQFIGPLDNPGFSYTPQIFFNFIQTNFPPKPFALKDAQEVQSKLALLNKFDNFRADFESVDKARIDLSQLNLLPYETPFRFLATFSIIEYLLTHKPKEVSIRHQLRTKIPLLNRRLQESMNEKLYFSQSYSLDTIIKKLYDYRSDIAHGSSIEISKGTVLESSEAATRFLYDLLRRLIMQAVIEPQFVTDLKNR